MTDVTERLSTALADRYTLQREIGAGGMATVYLAEDLKHRRQVAVKILRPELAAILGGERFLKEIEVTANLQHPNILPLYDSGEADAFLYYVMPYVEGESLRHKLNREKQLGVEETVEILKSVAAALEFAHERGVVHRDIKPENILFQSGQALVADFGIALAVSHAGGTRLTETGMSLGTPHYMSPEQATGDQEVDARSDVYSLGCVAYEMLVGEPPHVGNSVQAIIAKVLSETPAPVSTTRELVSPNVDAAIQQALARSPADRFTSAGRFAAALADPSFTLPTRVTVAAPAAVGPWKRASLALGGVAVVTTALAIWGLTSTGEPAARVSRFALPLPETAPLTTSTVGFRAPPFAVSPDGSRIVYRSAPRGEAPRLYSRFLDRLEPVAIPGTDSAAAPFFSPDGLWIGFHVENRLMKVPLAGGAATTLAGDVLERFAGASWGDDGYIVYTANGGRLHRINAAGGDAEDVLPADHPAAWWPHVLPGSGGVLFGVADPADGVAVLDRRSGEVKRLVDGAVIGWYAGTGHLVYARQDGAVFAARFDPDALELIGAPMPLLDGVRVGPRGAARLAFSQTGTMVFLPGGAVPGFQLVTVDHGGTAVPFAVPARIYYEPRLSPSGDRIAATVNAGGRSQVWIYDIAAATLTQLTFEGENVRPSWSPDGSSVSFASNRTGAWELFGATIDRSSPPERLSATEIRASGPPPQHWTRDGAWVVFDMEAEDGHRNVLGVDLRGDRTPQLIVAQRAHVRDPSVSPDGRWLAYVSNETGADEVYVRAFPGPGGRWQISSAGGQGPVWVSDDELAFVRLDTGMLELAVLTFGAGVEVAARRDLFDMSPYETSGALHQYDVWPDGERFLMLRQPEGPRFTPVVVLNWFEEIMQRQAEQDRR